MEQKMRFEGFSEPRYTPVPDQLIDQLMPNLTLAELRIVLYITRRTFGFKKEADNISLDQLASGIRTKDGRVLDTGTGISRRSLLPALKSLEAKQIIIRKERKAANGGSLPSVYSLNLKAQSQKAPTPRPSEAPRQGGEETSPPPREVTSPPGGEATSPHKKQVLTTNSLDNTLSPKVMAFYRGLGRSKVSRAKLERGVFELKELIQDGFTEEEIDFALQWLTKKPDTQSLGRLKHVMDQALVEFAKARRQILKQRQTDQEQTVAKAEEQASHERMRAAQRIFQSLKPTELTAYEQRLGKVSQIPTVRKMAITALIASDLKTLGAPPSNLR